jgi:hypothetical protein
MSIVKRYDVDLRILPITAVISIMLMGLGIGAQSAFAASSGLDGATSDRVTAQQVDEPCEASDTVLLIQDDTPWFSVAAGQVPRGAFVNELILQNKPWCAIGSFEINSTNLAQFKEVIIASDQFQEFYDNLFPGGVIHSNITAWVIAGGILSASLTDCGNHGGAWGTNGCGVSPETSYTFVGGLKHQTTYHADNNISDASNHLIADADPCPSGNCALQVDNGTQNDLDDWNAADHGTFLDLPPGTDVIISNEDGPAAIQYSFGSGKVIAHLNTDAWRYQGCFGGDGCTPNFKFVANDIAYQDALTERIVVGGEILPISMASLFTAGLLTGAAGWAGPAFMAGIGASIAAIIRMRRNKLKESEA